MFGPDLTFGSPRSKSRDLRRDGFRRFPVATRFDTLWADTGSLPSERGGAQRLTRRPFVTVTLGYIFLGKTARRAFMTCLPEAPMG